MWGLIRQVKCCAYLGININNIISRIDKDKIIDLDVITNNVVLIGQKNDDEYDQKSSGNFAGFGLEPQIQNISWIYLI